MAKGSYGRQRSRKINHKTRILVKTGLDAVGIINEPLEEGESRYELEDAPDSKLVAGTATHARGVDQGESEELHLKEVLAARSRGGSSSGGTSTPKTAIILNQVAGRFVASPPPPTSTVIPTPSSSGRVDSAFYSSLYPSGVYSDSQQLLRFSDTVEESITGAVDYDMDEQDEDWLTSFNRKVEEGKAKVNRKGESKEERSTITEDEFESIMEGFELAMEELTDSQQSGKSHAVPSFDALAPVLGRQPSFICRPLPDCASWIYPHWRQRRLARDGEPIVPRLNHSSTDNPYVCFRRREVKHPPRKTRRSDEQNLSRLTRVRDDLYAALELMKRVNKREKLLLEDATLDRQIFEAQVEVRELKRRLGEDFGDEGLLLVPEMMKKHVILGGARPPPQVDAASTSRRPSTPRSSLLPFVRPEERQRRKDNLAVIVKRTEQDEERKKAEDKGWDDCTSSAYHPRHLPARDHCWTAIEPKEELPRFRNERTGEWSTPLAPSRSPLGAGGRGPFYRKRMGRGGRIMLDRAGLGGREGVRVQALSEEKERDEEMTEAERTEEERAWARRVERHRYDDDLALSNLTTRDEPQIIDDFELPYLLRRSALLDWEDAETQQPDPAYLQDAFKYLDDLASATRLTKPPEVLGRSPRPTPPPALRPQLPPRTETRAPIPAANREGPNTSPIRAAEEARRISLQQSQLAAERERLLREQATRQAQLNVQDRISALETFIHNSASGPTVAKPPMFPSPKPSLHPTNGNRRRALPQAWEPPSATSQAPPTSTSAASSLQFGPLPPRPPLGANQLPATSNLAAPPYSSFALGPQRPSADSTPLAQPRSAPFSSFPPARPSLGSHSIAPRPFGGPPIASERNYTAAPQVSGQSLLASTPRRAASLGAPSPSPSPAKAKLVEASKSDGGVIDNELPRKRRRVVGQKQ